MSGFTKEQIYEARNADLEMYFMRKGYSLTPHGNSRFYVDGIKGLVVKGAYYKNFYADGKGGNAIDCLVNTFDMEFSEAVADLLGVDVPTKTDRNISRYQTKPKSSESKNVKTSPINVEHKDAVAADSVNSEQSEKKEATFTPPPHQSDKRRVIAYLTKTRKIPMPVVDVLLKSKHLYQDDKGNCVFPWFDDGKMVGAEVVGTLSEVRFKKIPSGSKEGYGFVLPYPAEQKEPGALFFFESAIDLMSYVAIHGWLEGSWYISMGGLKKSIMNNYMERYPKAFVFLCCDQDVRAFRFVASVIPDLKFTLLLPPLLQEGKRQLVLKDWNEVLQSRASA